MAVTIHCPHCGAAGNAPEHILGQSVRCSKCKQQFVAGGELEQADIPQEEPGDDFDDEGYAEQPRRRPSNRRRSSGDGSPLGFLSMRSLLNRLDSGDIITSYAGVAWQVAVCLAAAAALYRWLESWPSVGDMKFFFGVAFCIFQVALFISAFFAFQVMFLRGRDAAQDRGGRFVAVPIVARFFSALGESTAIFLSLMAVPMMINVWIMESQFVPQWDFNTLQTIDTLGRMPLAGCIFGAIVGFFVFRMIGEMMMAIFSIANNVEQLAGRDGSAAKR